MGVCSGYRADIVERVKRGQRFVVDLLLHVSVRSCTVVLFAVAMT